jgi:hypothetical protein
MSESVSLSEVREMRFLVANLCADDHNVFLQLCRHVDRKDWILIAIGTGGAIVTGRNRRNYFIVSL